MMLELTLSTVLSLVALTAWAANLLGMPGNWVMAAAAALSLWLSPESSRYYVGWLPLIGIVFVAGLGELLEFAAGALGAQRVGGTRRGTILAIVGSVVGAIVGLFVGTAIPPPILGNVIASLLLGASGAFAGAIAGERWAGKDWDSSLQVGGAAFWGRLLGTVGKAVCGTVVCGVFLAAIWF